MPQKKCSSQGPVFVLYTVYQNKKRPKWELSIRLELRQVSDKFFRKTWRAEINKLITLSSLHIILTCDIPWDILWDEIIALEINPHGRWRTFNHFRSLMWGNLGWVVFTWWQSLQHCHSSLHQFSWVYYTKQPLVPPFASSFLMCTEMWKTAHSGPTPGKGETSLELAHDQF